jgi:hypothetical protein
MRRFSGPFLLDLDKYVSFLYKQGRRRSKGSISWAFKDLFVKYIVRQFIFHIDTKWKRHVDGQILFHILFYFFSYLKSFILLQCI